MPPKIKKSPNGKKKSKASRRPSQTNLLSAGNEGRGRKTERSVMQTLEQEETTNNDPAPKRSAAQPPQPIAPPTKQVDMTRTVMVPPTVLPPAPAAPPAAPQPPAQGSQIPTMAPVTPTPPAPARPATGSQMPQAPPQAQPPAPRPPQPPAAGSQMPAMAPVAPVAPRPPVAQPVAPVAQPVVPVAPRPPVAQPVAQQPISPSPLAETAAARKMSREKDDGGSVDCVETSEKKKRAEVVNSWMRLVLQNGVEGLRKEYKDSINEAPMDKALAFSDNPTKNRYNNIPCCDTTRVKLADDPHFYIHANVVSSGPNPRRFICTQAPLNGTIEDFWKMVIVSGLEYIVMLCEVVEKGKPKSAEYFPVKIGDTVKVGKLCTITKESSQDIDKILTMSTMRISKPGDNSVVKTVKHIHWHNWPDHGVPDNFLTPFRLLNVVRFCQKPVVVHCSAGVGRTGTLVLILIILESICLPDFLGVPRLLTKLRDERFKSIQTEMQYLYVHRCILEYLSLKKYSYSKEDYAKFLREYGQVLTTCGVTEK